jgi:hypothetical protein
MNDYIVHRPSIWCQQRLHTRRMSQPVRRTWLVWPSGWVRTLFFNPTRPDGQDSKPSPRARTPKLAQGSGSDKSWPLRSTRRTGLLVQPSPSDEICLSTLGLIAQPEIFVWVDIRVGRSTDKTLCPIQPVGQDAVFDSTRRTPTRTRSTRSAKSACPVQPVRLRHCVQPCPNLGLDARARVQPNPTVTLNLAMPSTAKKTALWRITCHR